MSDDNTKRGRDLLEALDVDVNEATLDTACCALDAAEARGREQERAHAVRVIFGADMTTDARDKALERLHAPPAGGAGPEAGAK